MKNIMSDSSQEEEEEEEEEIEKIKFNQIESDGEEVEDEDDEDLKKAIELSLITAQQEEKIKTNLSTSLSNSINLNQYYSIEETNNNLQLDKDHKGPDDKDLRKAIQLSLNESKKLLGSSSINYSFIISEKSNYLDDKNNNDDDDDDDVEFISEKRTSSIESMITYGENDVSSQTRFKLDRKQLEKERLERLAKRKLDNEIYDNKRLKTENPSISNNIISNLKSFSETPLKNDQLKTGSFNIKGDLLPKYLDGAVKLTHVNGFDGDYIRIEDLIIKNHVRRALFTTFVFEREWLESYLPENIDVVVVKHWNRADSKMGMEKAPSTKLNMLYVHPPLNEGPNGEVWGKVHSKLMVIEYDKFLRVVVSSANLVGYDWSQLENCVFVQDFPIPTSKTITKVNTVPFYRDLQTHLRHLCFPSPITNIIDDWDYSKAKARLIESIPGHFSGEHSLDTELILKNKKWIGPSHDSVGGFLDVGGGALMRILKEEKLDDLVNIEYQTASLGATYPSWVYSWWKLACGEMIPSGRKKKKENRTPSFQIIYPSQSTVESSLGGPRGAGTIMFAERFYDAPQFPRHLLKDCVSKREGLLMHSKIVIARYKNKPGGWIYLGSHNFSSSAWGYFSTSTTRQEPQVDIRNYELGVILPLDDSLLSSFKPWQDVKGPYPGKPWMFQGLNFIPNM